MIGPATGAVRLAASENREAGAISRSAVEIGLFGRASRLAILVVPGLVLLLDLAQVPQRQATAWWLLQGISVYQRNLAGPLSTSGIHCRLEPSCSHYAAAAIGNRGAVIGTVCTIKRLLRCGPWTPAGTWDPPPPPTEQRQNSLELVNRR